MVYRRVVTCRTLPHVRLPRVATRLPRYAFFTPRLRSTVLVPHSLPLVTFAARATRRLFVYAPLHVPFGSRTLPVATPRLRYGAVTFYVTTAVAILHAHGLRYHIAVCIHVCGYRTPLRCNYAHHGYAFWFTVHTTHAFRARLVWMRGLRRLIRLLHTFCLRALQFARLRLRSLPRSAVPVTFHTCVGCRSFALPARYTFVYTHHTVYTLVYILRLRLRGSLVCRFTVDSSDVLRLRFGFTHVLLRGLPHYTPLHWFSCVTFVQFLLHTPHYSRLFATTFRLRICPIRVCSVARLLHGYVYHGLHTLPCVGLVVHTRLISVDSTHIPVGLRLHAFFPRHTHAHLAPTAYAFTTLRFVWLPV